MYQVGGSLKRVIALRSERFPLTAALIATTIAARTCPARKPSPANSSHIHAAGRSTGAAPAASCPPRERSLVGAIRARPSGSATSSRTHPGGGGGQVGGGGGGGGGVFAGGGGHGACRTGAPPGGAPVAPACDALVAGVSGPSAVAAGSAPCSDRSVTLPRYRRPRGKWRRRRRAWSRCVDRGGLRIP